MPTFAFLEAFIFGFEELQNTGFWRQTMEKTPTHLSCIAIKQTVPLYYII
jgi:hypothetical protein